MQTEYEIVINRGRGSESDGALQYVLGARQELDDAIDGDQESADRIDQALGEASRLLRGTMSQLDPAVLDTAGLLPALRDMAESFRARGRSGSSSTATAGRGTADRGRRAVADHDP